MSDHVVLRDLVSATKNVGALSMSRKFGEPK